MERYGRTTYGDTISEVYDELYSGMQEIPPVVDVLASLAKGGKVLELAIGTGRIALPLAARGLEIHGIDASPKMVAKLRAKPGGKKLPITMGDFADVGAPGSYDLIFIVFNTIFALLTQEDQVRCFKNVAKRLCPGGAFVVEAFVPDLTRYARGQSTNTLKVDVDSVQLDVSRHEIAQQTVTVQHVIIKESGTRLYPVKLRYIWPSEMDLMARLAGLRLESRWRDWDKQPFTSASGKHVSVYRKG
jgi:SAM-dependent methyltransferase